MVWFSESVLARIRALEKRTADLEDEKGDHYRWLMQLETRVKTIERGGFGSTPRKLDGLSTDPDNSIRRTSSGG